MKSEQVAWLISNDGMKKFGIDIQGKQFPDSHSIWDNGWLISSVHFQDENFKVDIDNKSMYEKNDLKNLLKDLDKINKNSAGELKFEVNEPYVKFTIKIEKTGNGYIKGEIWNVHPESSKLIFEFSTDQTCIREFYKSLKRIYDQI